MYCFKCKAKLVEGNKLCPNCGTRIPDNYHPKAGGILRSWLWVMLFGGLYVEIKNIEFAIEYPQATLYAIIASIVEIGILFGIFRLYNGYKQGFYIICVCAAINILYSLILSGFSLMLLLIPLGPVILWFFAKEQWKYFR